LLRDRFKRPITSLRISVTKSCNLKCIFCHGEGEKDADPAENEMTSEEIEKIVRIAASFGVKKVKLTGGEPLLRKDICEIVSRISGVSGIEEVSMTTNGLLLAKLAKDLKEAGLSRVNINLASLNPQIYEKITGFNCVKDVLDGVNYALRFGLKPVKINMVVLRSLNEDEVWSMINFVSNKDIILQLIELENLGDAKNLYDKYYVSLDKVEQQLTLKAEKVEVRSLHNRKVYYLNENGGKAKVELVRPFHNSSFCMNCNRLRVTASGKLKLCLMKNDNLVDIVSYIRRNASEKMLHEIFLKTVMSREPYFK
jgi:cyclic pyranopterin phosphate synthase